MVSVRVRREPHAGVGALWNELGEVCPINACASYTCSGGVVGAMQRRLEDVCPVYPRTPYWNILATPLYVLSLDGRHTVARKESAPCVVTWRAFPRR